jgi:hypothetical protein
MLDGGHSIAASHYAALSYALLCYARWRTSRRWACARSRSRRWCCAPSESRARTLLAPRAQPADKQVMSSHLAAGGRLLSYNLTSIHPPPLAPRCRWYNVAASAGLGPSWEHNVTLWWAVSAFFLGSVISSKVA